MDLRINFVTVQEPKHNIGHGRLLLHYTYTMASSAVWAALVPLLIPSQTLAMLDANPEHKMGDRKGLLVGVFMALINITQMVAAPLIGSWSDKTGKRRIHIIYSVLATVLLINSLALITRLAHVPSSNPKVPVIVALSLYGFALVLTSFFGQSFKGIFDAIIVDKISHTAFGAASGWGALMNSIGILFGGILGVVLDHVQVEICMAMLSSLLLFGLFALLFVWRDIGMESSVVVPYRPMRGQVVGQQSVLDRWWQKFSSPFKKSKNFPWVFLIRFAMSVSWSCTQTFLLYYIRDIQAPLSIFGTSVGLKTGVSVVLVSSCLSAILFAPISGILSDRYGRKPFVAFVSFVGGVIGISVGFLPRNFDLYVVLMTLVGVSTGVFVAVDGALINDVLPSCTEFAKDLGVYNIAVSLPFILITPIAGVAFDHLQKVEAVENLGYKVIFAFAGTSALFAMLFVSRVRVEKPTIYMNIDEEEAALLRSSSIGY